MIQNLILALPILNNTVHTFIGLLIVQKLEYFMPPYLLLRSKRDVLFVPEIMNEAPTSF